MVASRLIDRLRVGSDQTLLDVGTGRRGTVATRGAMNGARAIGVDIVPELLGDAHEFAAAAGVEVDWVEADVEHLPFEDERFDHVVSTFGHMFAPDHERAASEMARVCRQDGQVGLCCWSTIGLTGSVLEAIRQHVPVGSELTTNPYRWGDPDYSISLLSPFLKNISVHCDGVVSKWPDAKSYVDFYSANFGPYMRLKQALGRRWPPLASSLESALEQWNTAEDGTLQVTQHYLLLVGRKAPTEHAGSR